MPFYDRRCQSCEDWVIDSWETMSDSGDRLCLKCGGSSVRAHRSTALPDGRVRGVIGDYCDITIKHGLCNPDGTPRRYTSKSDIKREAEKRGFTNLVEHKGDERRGGDKSKHTSRWV